MVKLFFTKDDIDKLDHEKLWDDFSPEFLLQPAPVSFDKCNDHRYRVYYYNGKECCHTYTYDKKFASWIITECCVAYLLQNDKRYFDSARSWCESIINTEIWDHTPASHNIMAGVDLQYGNLSYASSFFLDTCADQIDCEYKDKLVAKMKKHLDLGYEIFCQGAVEDHPYTQNHFFIPLTGYLCLCIALKNICYINDDYIKAGVRFIDKIFAGLGNDGWYYEGIDYAHYALIWLIRLAEISDRHFGFNCVEYPLFTNLHRFYYWSMYPRGNSYFNIGDNSPKQWDFDKWKNHLPQDYNHARFVDDITLQNYSHIFYWIGRKLHDPDFRAIADNIKSRGFRWPEGFWSLLWTAPKKSLITEGKHFFDDIGIWVKDTVDESGNTLRVLAKCGPPLGYRLETTDSGMARYKFNAGHVHPDAGSVYAAWNDLPVLLGPGYLGIKKGIFQNSICFNGRGQFDDRLYHAFDPETTNYNKLKEMSIVPDIDDSGITMNFTNSYETSLTVNNAIRKVSIDSPCSFIVSDDVSTDIEAYIEAYFRVSDPPEIIGTDAIVWDVCGQKMSMQVLNSQIEYELFVYPGNVITINDCGKSGPLECGDVNQRGYQILLRSERKVKKAKWTVQFRVI